MSIGDVTRPRSVKPAKSDSLRLPSWLSRLGLVSAFALIELLVLLTVFFVSYQVLYKDKIHRGVKVWNLDLSGLNRAEAQILLIDYFAELGQSSWELRDMDQVWSVSPSALGIHFDAEATVDAAFGVGRSRSFAWNLGEQLRSASRGIQVAPVVLYDELSARRYLEELAHAIYRPTQDAALTVHELQIYETRPQVGRQLDVAATLAALKQATGRLGRKEINLAVRESSPHIIDAGIAHNQAATIIGEALYLSVPGALFTAETTETREAPGPWQLSREDLADLLIVDELAVGSDGSARLDVTLDAAGLAVHLAAINEVISRTATSARFIFNDDTRQLEVIVPSTSGLELDVETSVERIIQQAFLSEREVQLAVNVIPAEFDESTTAEQLGITEMVASSTSYFAGSSAGRRNNVQVASAKFHGILIKPGQTFSFNEWLGEVTEEEGYDESLIIFGNETIPDVGGGVCQVSTTAYRAAFWAGLPITERWAHAYRVGFYEQGGQPVGLDATIYSPQVDLKFANDTPHHLLIETYVNQDASTLTFKFYSGGNGRIVEMEGPVVTDVIEHDPPIYKEDPDVAPGEIKQVEWATNGLTSVITRVIKDASTGQVIERKEFKSKFRPWNAVYLVAPGTEVPGHDVIRLNDNAADPTS